MEKKKFYKTTWFMWVMVVFFWPVGLIMLWTKKDLNLSKKTKGIITGAVIILFVIGSVFSGNETTNSTDKSEATNTEVKEEKPVEEPVKELTFEEAVEEIADKVLGKDNFTKVQWDDDTKTSMTIYLKMSDNLTNNMIKRGMLLDSEKMLKELSSNDTFRALTHITIIHETEFVDKLGNTSMGNAGIASIDVSTVLKIKWDNFLTDNLPDICTSYYVHPSLNK